MTYVAQGSRTVVRDDIVFGSVSHVGMERTENQDFCGYYEPDDDNTLELKGRLFVVCDGMGGHAGGEIASRMGVEKIVECYYSDPGSNTIEAIKHAIEASSRNVWDKAQEQPALRGMGSTSVVMALKNNMAYFGHVGDSRAYIIRAGKIEQITKDHSLVQQMVDEGLLEASEMENHPDKNVILRSMGVKPEVDVDILYHPVEAGDIYLLCTDGLSGLVSDEEILNITLANEANPQEACQRLVDLANAYGGYDNTTVQIIRVARIQAGPPPSDMTTGVFTADQVQESINRARADLGMPAQAAPPPPAPGAPTARTPAAVVKTQPSMAAPNLGGSPRLSSGGGGSGGGGGGGGGKLGMALAALFGLLFLMTLMCMFTVQGGVNDYRMAVDNQTRFYQAGAGLTSNADDLQKAEEHIKDGVSALRGLIPFGASGHFEEASELYRTLETTQTNEQGRILSAAEAGVPHAKGLADLLGAQGEEDYSAAEDAAKRAESTNGQAAKILLLREAESRFYRAANAAAKQKCAQLNDEIERHLNTIRQADNLTQPLLAMAEELKAQAGQTGDLERDNQFVAAYWSYDRIASALRALAAP